jgi:adenylate cyclase
MNQEIERKFLVKSLPENLSQYKSYKIKQGYLANDKNLCQVRVRSKNDQYSLTFKKGRGLVRDETEVKISDEQFQQIWLMTTGRQLTKTRYEIPFEKYTVELDIFDDPNQGVVFAEVEFASISEAEAFVPPIWFGLDITGDGEYSNFKLSR